MSEKREVTRAAGRMSAATMISRVLGYVRDMLFAAFFGATASMDAFLVAFRIPNLLRELFAEGSMSAALVPVLTETQEREGREAADLLARVVFTFILSVVGGITALGIISAPAIVTLVAPGFLDDPEKFRATVLLTRVMFPFLLFVSLAAFSMGMLNTRGVFFLPALAPAVLNVVTIAVVAALASRVRPPVMAAALGFSFGGLVQFLFQIPALLKAGFSLRLLFSFSHRGLRTILRRTLPVILSMSTSQINIFVTTILASFLATGSITYLFYGMRLIHLPIGIFGVAMATAVLPSLSRLYVKDEHDEFRETFSHALRLLLFLTIPAMAGLVSLRTPIVITLFQRGEFDAQGTSGTATALFYYSLGIASMVGVRLLASTFYARGNTKTPVKIAVIGMTSNIALSLLLIGPLKHGGLALANALAATIQFVLLGVFLRRDVGRLDLTRIYRSVLKTLCAAGAMCVPALYVSRLSLWTAGGTALRVGTLAASIGFCLAIYIGVARALGSEELPAVLERGRKKIDSGGRNAP